MSKHNPKHSTPGPPLQADGREQFGAGHSLPTPPELVSAGTYPARVAVPAYNPNALALLAQPPARLVALQLGWRRDKTGDWALGKPPAPGVGTNHYAGFDLLTAQGHIAGLHGGALGLIPASIGMAVVDVDSGDVPALIRHLGNAAPYLVTPTPRRGGMHLWWHCPPELGAGVEDCFWRIGDWAGDLRYARGYVALWPETPEILAPHIRNAAAYPHFPAALFMGAKTRHPKSGAGSWAPENQQWDNPEDGRKGGIMSGITRRKQGQERKRAALALQAQGYGAGEIASELGISRMTAWRYLRPDYLPEVHREHQRHLPMVA